MKGAYTPDRSTIISDIKRYGGTAGIAAHYGVSIYQVRYQRRKNNLLTRGLNISMPTRKELIDALKELGSGLGVSYRYGVSPSTITRWKKILEIEIEHRTAKTQLSNVKESCRQDDTHSIGRKIKKGMRFCLKCHSPFYSEDLRLIRICKKCKANQSRMARVEHYRVITQNRKTRG